MCLVSAVAILVCGRRVVEEMEMDVDVANSVGRRYDGNWYRYGYACLTGNLQETKSEGKGFRFLWVMFLV